MASRGEEIDASVRRANAAPLPKRFYAEVAVRAHANGFAVVLDDKPIRTPGKAELVVQHRNVAESIAAEWRAQVAVIDPKSMPLTRLVNSTIDGVAGNLSEVAADCLRYAGSDLLCYRADGPAKLVALQAKHWDPVLAWAQSEFGCGFKTAVGVGYVEQPKANAAPLADAIGKLDAFQLAGLQSMTTLMGSVLLALAVQYGQLGAAAAWAAAHVDEDFQIGQWGEDAEARSRREFRWADMQAAARLVRI